MPPAHAVPKRPGSHRPREGIPAAHAQDAGLHRPGRRPLPHPAHAHPRDDGDLPRSGTIAAPERGPRGGDRARPRSRPHTVRACGGRRSRRNPPRALRPPLSPQRALAPRCRRARARRTRSQPHRRGARRDPQPHRPERARDARGQDRAARRPGRVHQPRHRRRGPRGRSRPRRAPARGDRAARADRLTPDRHARPRPRRDLRARERHPPDRADRRGNAHPAVVHVRPRLPGRGHTGRAHARPRSRAPHLRPSARPRRFRGRRDRLHRGHDRPLRAELRRDARLMARIHEASVREAVEAADMVEVVSARTQLRRAGARFTGLCPFHDEKTPSFSVNPSDKLFYCFGCGKGGDLITFVRETEQLDFAQAVEWLAERYRVTLEYEESSPQQDAARSRRERLLALLEQATSFYERYLWDASAGEPARAYLESRSLGEEICREYRLGLAPGGQTLARKAREKGFTPAELAAGGLVNRRGNDYFSGRLLFPLADARGRVRGFQARKLREDDPLRAKYVNSPEGELFRKGDLLYGLDRARAAITKQERAIVVEGNPDVLALRQAGLEPVVAPMGTALTERQLKELSRLAHKVYLCFDGDAAGEAATLRGMELAAAQGFDVKVVALPAGSDPADAPEGFEERLARAESYLGYRVRLEIERAPDRQEGFVRVRQVLERFDEDSPERQDAVRLAADRLDLPKETQAGLAPGRGGSLTGAISPRLLEAGARLERDALAGVAAHPELHSLLAELDPEHFDFELHRKARAHLLQPGEPDEELVPLLAELDARASEGGIDDETAKELLLRLRERQLRRELAGADLDRTKELQEQLEKIRATVANLV